MQRQQTLPLHEEPNSKLCHTECDKRACLHAAAAAAKLHLNARCRHRCLSRL